MSSFSTYPQTEEEKQLYYRSEMNDRQFKALAHRLTQADIENEILNNQYFLRRVRLSRKCSKSEVEQWLKNSWNTERVLILNKSIINDSGQSFCMQWAFPQAYYAVFGSIMAMFKALGFTESSHTAVLKKFTLMMENSHLPESISITCNGIDKNFVFNNIPEPKVVFSNLALDLNDSDTINNQICQFLGATRSNRLKDKKSDIKIRTKGGKYRQNFRPEDWQQVSRALGSTSIIDFLYRKRIKGNYEDIETYSCPYFNGRSVLKNLTKVVDRINLVNETYIAKAIGYKQFERIALSHVDKVENKKLRSRLDTTKSILEAYN